MLSTKFSVIDYCVFILLLIASSLIGVFFWWKSRNNASNEEFLTGGRKLGLFPVTLSLVASFMSTNTMLGLPAEVYQVGTQIIMQSVAIALGVILAAEVFMPIYHKMEIISVYEVGVMSSSKYNPNILKQYLSKRYESEYLRIFGTIGFLLATVPYMAVVLYGPSLALSSVTPLSIPTCILVVGFICTFYSSVGGIKAVIWTDVLQCILMFMGVFMVIIEGTIEAGGPAQVWKANKDGGRLIFFNFEFDLYNHDNIWNVIIGLFIFWASVHCVMQTQVQRYNSLESIQKARKALYWNLPGLVFFAVLAVLCGNVIYAKYRDCDPVTLGLITRHDQLMPYFVMDALAEYPGLPGLFVACVFSGSLSTLSSGYNALAAVTWEDLLKDRLKIKSKRLELNMTKIIAVAYGLLAIGMSFGVGNVGTVLQACMAIVGSMVGPLFALFCLGFFFPHTTALGSAIGYVIGILISLSLTIGGLAVPRPKVSLPTTLNSCAPDVLEYAYNRYNGLPNSSFIHEYHNPQGVAKFFHISYLILSLMGFLTTLILGIILSFFIGKRIKYINTDLMWSPNKFFSWNKTVKLNSNKY